MPRRKMNVASNSNSADGSENREPECPPADVAAADVITLAPVNDPEPLAAEAAEPAESVPADTVPTDTVPTDTVPGEDDAGSPAEMPLAEIAAAVRDLAGSAQRYHARAEQREGVIDHLREEVDRLRRGERRGVLRPMLADLCRLRDDLLKQAATLPEDFTAAKAADLLRSYAETIELTLETNGVVTYAPDTGERFDPRLHRRVTGAPTADPAQAGQIAAVQRDGYLDIEANSPIATAEVSVFAVTKGEQ
jgi:molecular chaperone GrpE